MDNSPTTGWRAQAHFIELDILQVTVYPPGKPHFSFNIPIAEARSMAASVLAAVDQADAARRRE